MQEKEIKKPRFYVTERLSANREKTPEGYLLCRNVPISRVGSFEYGENETTVKGRDGVVMLTRTAQELFSPDTIASYEGKPIVIGHGTFATPANWSSIAKGHIQNVRRGEGPERGLLLADLLIQQQDAIDAVESGRLTEVSCGYDATAVDDGGGNGHQVGIVGNHLALVKKARCGELCHIGDGFVMNLKTKLRRLFRDGDEEAFNAALDEAEVKEASQGDSDPGEDPKAVKVPDEKPQEAPKEEPKADEAEGEGGRFEALEQRLAALEEAVSKLAPAQEQGDEDGDPAPEDAKPEEEPAPTDEEAEEALVDAETLCPGVKKPQGDSASGKLSAEAVRRLKKSALDGAGVTMFGDTASLNPQALDVAFKAAVAAKKKSLNPVATGFKDGAARPSEDLNETFRKFWRK